MHPAAESERFGPRTRAEGARVRGPKVRLSDQPMSSSRTPLVSFMYFATKTIDSAAKAA